QLLQGRYTGDILRLPPSAILGLRSRPPPPPPGCERKGSLRKDAALVFLSVQDIGEVGTRPREYRACIGAARRDLQMLVARELHRGVQQLARGAAAAHRGIDARMPDRHAGPGARVRQLADALAVALQHELAAAGRVLVPDAETAGQASGFPDPGWGRCLR